MNSPHPLNPAALAVDTAFLLAVLPGELAHAFIQVKALDRRFNEDGKRCIELAQLAGSNESFDIAVEIHVSGLQERLGKPRE